MVGNPISLILVCLDAWLKYMSDSNRRGKLSKKAEKLRFIGYSHQTKGYRLIDKTTSTVVIR